MNALVYAHLGYGVFPVELKGKAPATRNGLKDATTDVLKIESWLGYNIGLLPPSGVLVLDADSAEEVTRLETEYPELAAAPRCDTPSGGAHIYTRLPDGVAPPKTSVKVQGRALDVRGLAKAYVVAPPSTLPTGAYRWARPLVSPDELPETPAGVLELLQPKARTQPAAAPPKSPADIHDRARKYAQTALQAEHDRVATAAEGERNATLNRAAFSLGQLVGSGALDRAEVEDALRGAAMTCGLAADETEATLQSGLGAGMREPREIPPPKAKARADAPPEGADDSERSAAPTSRPEIAVNDRHMREITADALTALLEANDPPVLYLRGTIPARVNGDKIEALTAISLKGRLDRVADFVKLTHKTDKETGETTAETKPARPPADVPPDILTQPELPFPSLEEIVHAPVFLPSGALLATDGYNPEHGLLMRLKGLSALRADLPIDEALAQLGEVYGDFPFTEEAGRAHALAMILQPFVRPLIRGATPMYLIDAPARGTGKGLLAEVCNLIGLGYIVPTMSLGRDSDELEKRITSVLLEARAVVFIDNVSIKLDSPHLAAALTSENWQGRILGKSETVTLPNRALWLASGNNVDLSDEMTRRVIPIRLDAGVERPEERSGFKHAPLAMYVRENRSELVSACLSIVQAWVNEGMPKGEATLGRFEAWAGVMGGILGVSGVSGFLSGRERLYAEADKETTEWAVLCEAWWVAYREHPVTAKDVFDVAKDRGLLLDIWGGRSQQGAMQRFGHALSSRRDRVFGGYKIQSAGKDGVTRNAAYRLARPPNKTTETPETPTKVAETPSQTQETGRVFWGDAGAKHPETTAKHPQNNRAQNHVQDGTSTPSPVVSGVSGVLNRPPAEKQNAGDGEKDKPKTTWSRDL